VVIGNLDIFHAIIRPYKTNAVLIVNPYTVLSLPIIPKGFQQISRWNFQRFQGNDPIKLIELSLGYSPDLLRTDQPGFSGVFPVKDVLCALVTERLYHPASSSA
jgi:hypothetical protein